MALQIVPAFANFPLYFEPSQTGIGFVSQDGFRIAAEGIAPGPRIRNANPHAVVKGENLLPGHSNYLMGRDPAKWRTNIRHYERVRVTGILPQIDIVYYGSGQSLEYDLILHPGADPSQLALRFDQGTCTIAPSGDLEIATASGTLIQHKPLVRQNDREIAAAYTLDRNGDIRIALGPYDRTRELVVDPVLNFSTYVGGGVYDSPNAIAVDSSGNSYIAGSTSSFNFPVTIGAARTAFPTTPAMVAFVAKLNPAGTALVYATYLGGSGVNGGDAANGIAVDASGNAYVAGTTGSADFPVTGGVLGTALHGPIDAFVTKLNPAGTALVYSTYLGGSGTESGAALALDAAGNAFVAGSTGSSDFPATVGALQGVLRSANDAFLAKLNPTATALVYATYLGGTQEDDAAALAVDAAGNAYLAGSTASPDFPTLSAYQSTLTGSAAAFAAKINPLGTALLYSTFIGGSGGDYASSIAVDASGIAYIAGTTYSGNFPVTTGAYAGTVPGAAGLGHGFVSKLAANGASLAYSTFLGGSSSDAITGLALDSAGDAILTGFTYSANFPVSANSLDPVAAFSPTGFVSKINSGGSSLLYSTLLGASGSTAALAVALDGANHAYTAGYTSSQNFPTTAGAFQSIDGSVSGQTGTGFVSKIDLGSATVCPLSLSAPSLSVPVLGGAVSTTVMVAAGCAWEAISASSWLSVASPSHWVGGGSVAIAASSNQGNLAARSGTVAIGGVLATITQPAGLCDAPQLLPATQSFGSSGGTGSVAIVLPASCSYAALSNVSWIAITSGAAGTGDSLLEFTVLPDAGASRTGTLTIAGLPYTVSQLTSVCGYNVRFSAGQIAPSGGGIFVAGLTTAADCSWTASSNAVWLLVTSPGFLGSGPIFFQAMANNTGSPRSAIVTIAGQSYIVWQYANSQSTSGFPSPFVTH